MKNPVHFEWNLKEPEGIKHAQSEVQIDFDWELI